MAYVYPEVKIITSAMDAMVNDSYHIIPGVGNYGDRYREVKLGGQQPKLELG